MALSLGAIIVTILHVKPVEVLSEPKSSWGRLLPRSFSTASALAGWGLADYGLKEI